MKKLFSLLFCLLMVLPLVSQDSESGGPFGRNLENVYTRPTFSRGALMYKDYTLRFRNAYTYIYSSSDSGLTVKVDTVDFNTDVIRQGQGFWGDAPLPVSDPQHNFQYFNDFIGVVPFPASTGVAGGWKSSGDATYDVLSAAGTLGGWVLLAPEAGSNNELYLQMGEKGTETFVECTVNNGKKWWLEFNLTPSSVTNAASWFVGLAEEGSAAANFIHDDGDDIADKDAILIGGFEADADSLTLVYQVSGSAFNDTLETLITATNMTLGFYFDGATTLYTYKDGTVLGSTDVSLALFPTGEELSPIIAMKQGTSAININVDWIKLVAER